MPPLYVYWLPMAPLGTVEILFSTVELELFRSDIPNAIVDEPGFDTVHVPFDLAVTV